MGRGCNSKRPESVRGWYAPRRTLSHRTNDVVRPERPATLTRLGDSTEAGRPPDGDLGPHLGAEHELVEPVVGVVGAEATE